MGLSGGEEINTGVWRTDRQTDTLRSLLPR